jgi:hypothetical protein
MIIIIICVLSLNHKISKSQNIINHISYILPQYLPHHLLIAFLRYGFGKNGSGAGGGAGNYELMVGIGRIDDDGDMCIAGCFLKMDKGLKSIFFRHVLIQDDDIGQRIVGR